VDGGYRSKASCISDDIRGLPNGYCLTNVFNGKRAELNLFWDALIKKVFNARLNAAVNHIKVGSAKCFV